MVKLILVNKNSDVKETVVKNFVENLLYKKCNFRNDNNFGKVNTYKIKFVPEKQRLFLYENGKI